MTEEIVRIEAVEAEAPATLNIRWRDGTSGRVDLSGWIAKGTVQLKRLLDPVFFATAQVADWGTLVAWGEEEDDLNIDDVHLALLQEEQRPFGADDLVGWQKRARMSNIEAAGFLHVAASTYSRWKAGDGEIPTMVAMVCRASLRDPVMITAHFRPRKPTGRPRKVA